MTTRGTAQLFPKGLTTGKAFINRELEQRELQKRMTSGEHT